VTIRKIIYYPDDVLRQETRPVDEVDDEVRALVDDMIETMYDAQGIGLAAPQIGVLDRITVIDTRSGAEDEEPDLHVLINPEIVWTSEETGTYDEGCLSIPGVYEEVERPERVRVRALDRDGEPYEIEADGLLSVCIQHEVDHLDGVLFLDHISGLKRRMLMKKYKKILAKIQREEREAAEQA
jgi:peptide deformylase